MQAGDAGIPGTAWIIVLSMLTCSPCIACGCFALSAACCHFDDDGHLVIIKLGWRLRRKLIEKSIATKVMKNHAAARQSAMICINATSSSIVRTDLPNNTETISTIVTSGSDYDHSRCAICYKPYQNGDSISWSRNTITCNHAFHTNCLKAWLKKNEHCPCCRTKVIETAKLHRRCNGWKDYFFMTPRRAREIESIRKHKLLLNKCRDYGQYCTEHGLVFPFAQPSFEQPFDPTIDELEAIVQEVVRRFTTHGIRNQQGHSGIGFGENDVELQIQAVSMLPAHRGSQFPLRIPSGDADSS